MCTLNARILASREAKGKINAHPSRSEEINLATEKGFEEMERLGISTAQFQNFPIPTERSEVGNKIPKLEEVI